MARAGLRSGWRRSWAVALVAVVAGPVTATVATTAHPVPAGAAALSIGVARTEDDHLSGSLREALDQANAGAFDAVTITLPEGTYVLDLCAPPGSPTDDANVDGDLDASFTAPLTIVGSGAGAAIEQTCAGERVLDRAGAGLLTLQHVTVTGGAVTGSPALGGGVRSQAPVLLDGATVTGNAATGDPGSPGGVGGDAEGGGIWSAGGVELRSSTLTANTALAGATPSGSAPQLGEGGAAVGGGVRAGGAVTLVDATVTGNHATATLADGDGKTSRSGSATGGAVAATTPDPVTITRSTIEDNSATGGYGDAAWSVPQVSPGGVATGGAVAAAGPVTIDGGTLRRNRAEGGHGEGFDNGGDASGGAVHTTGSIDVSSTTIEQNTAIGGGANERVELYCACARSRGIPGGGRGGALHAAGPVTLTAVTASGNGGRIGQQGAPDDDGLGGGGLVWSAGDVTVSGGTFTANDASYEGGVVLGEGAVHVADATFGTNVARGVGGAVSAGGDLVVERSSFDHGAGARGGAVSGASTVSIRDSRFDDNTGGDAVLGFVGFAWPGFGGAVAADGNVDIARSTFRRNAVRFPAITDACASFPAWHCPDPLPSFGGAVWSGADVHLDAVTIAGSTVHGSPYPYGSEGSCGGGGAVAAVGAVTAANTTFDGNASVGGTLEQLLGCPGAAIQAAAADLGDVTVIDGTGSDALDVTTLAVRQSVLVDQRHDQYDSVPAGALCAAAVSTVSEGWSWADDGSCGLTAPTDHVGDEEVHLGLLADNGGPTPTRLPAAFSPIVDAVPADQCAQPQDQRGVARPAGVACDIGAVDTVGGPAPAADLSVLVTGPTQSYLGDVAGFDVTVGAAGDVGFPTVTIDVPDGSWEQWAPAGAACARPSTTQVTCTWPAGLPAGASATVIVVGSPRAPFTVHAAVRGLGPDPDPTNDESSVRTDVSILTDVGITGATADPVSVGGDTTLTVVVRDTGPSPMVGTVAHPLTLDVTLPDGITATSIPGGAWTCAANGNVVHCENPTEVWYWDFPLAFGLHADASVSVGTYDVGTAFGGGAGSDPDPSNNARTASLDVVDVRPDLAVAATVGPATPVPAGTDGTVEVVITNGRPDPAIGTADHPVTATVDLPDGLQPTVLPTAAGWSCGASAQRVTCTAAGPVDAASLTVGFHADPALPPTDLVATAAVTAGSSLDADPANDSAIVPVPVVSVADLAVSVGAADPTAPIGPGHDTAFVVHVTDLGPSSALGTDALPVTVVVVLPAGLTPTGLPSAPGWTCAGDGAQVTCGFVGALTTADLTIGVHVEATATAPATVAIDARVTSGASSDPVATNDAASTAVSLVRFGGAFHPVVPNRLLDSRTSTGGWSGRLAAGAPRALTVAGSGAVPASASAVVLNVTVTDGDAGSYLTVWPSDRAQPTVANINFAPGQTIPNQVVVRVGDDGRILLANGVGSTHVVVDLVGWYDDGTGEGAGRYTSVAPRRFLDSRTPLGGWNGPLSAGDAGVRTLAVRGVDGVPDDATAVVMNVTVTGADRGSFLEVWPSGADRPTAASLNFAAGQTISNLVTAQLGADGSVSFYDELGSVHVVVDVVGWFSPSSGDRFHVLDAPTRILDDRDGTGVTGPWVAGQTRDLPSVAAAVPAGASAVVANLAATNATTGSYVVAFPSGAPVPDAANLTFGPFQTIANLAATRLSPDRSLALHNHLGTVDLVLDLTGYYAPT